VKLDIYGAVQEGAARVLYLPAPEEHAMLKSPKHPQILVVDDDPESADVVANLLVLSGCVARIARDGLEAIAVAEEMLPDAVLLDICLPRIDGCETARRLRQDARFAKTRIVAFSGAEPGPWVDLFDSTVSKPCTFDEVEAALGLGSLER
jgi:CheY-like chemotaxis protein